MSKMSYWLDGIGKAGVLLGPAESALRLAISGAYEGPKQVDEGIGILTAGLATWKVADYVGERENKTRRSPLVHAGRAFQVTGTAATQYMLLIGNEQNVFRAFAPAALGITVGAFFEYVAGPLHEKISSRYRKA